MKIDLDCTKNGININRTWHFGKCFDPIINNTQYLAPYLGSWNGGGFGYLLSLKCIKIIIYKNIRQKGRNKKKVLFLLT